MAASKNKICKNGLRSAMLKKLGYNKYNQFLISTMKGITKDCLSLQ